MKATSRRLLSWLIVATMVLSMVPVFDLANFAVTTKAAIPSEAQTAISDAEAIINAAKELGEFAAPENGATSITKYCPVCGADQEWTALSGTGLETMVFTKEDSKITYHHYYLSDNATFSGSAMTTGGGNNHYVCLNLNGKTLSTGAVAITTNYGNVFNIMDTAGEGVLVGKSAGASAAAINVQNPNAKVNIYGGTIKRDAGSNAYSSVMYIQGLGGKINLYAGTVDGTGVSNTSYATVATLTANESRTATFNMYGGEVKCGTTTGDGNILVKANATFNMYGGTVKDGAARGGGNFNVNTGVLNLYEGTISGGQSGSTSNATVSGGNIILTSGGSLNMEGGVICGGNATKTHGGNIQIRRDQVGHINISGGKIYGGTAANGIGANIYAYGTATGSTMTISGTAEIAGGVYAGENVTTTLTGTPKILANGLTDAQGNPVTDEKGLEVTGKSNVDVAGLVEGAQIQVTGAKGAVFTAACENAATVAEYFKSLTEGTEIGVVNNQLQIAGESIKNDVFEPWKFEGQAYCPVCQEVKTWTDFNTIGHTAGATLASGHYYLSDSITDTVATGTVAYIKNTSGAASCFNLNGKNLTVENGRVFGSNNQTVKLNVMDTAETGVVTGNGASSGSVFMIGGGNAASQVGIYGGTFKPANNATSAVYITGNGGTVKMYGGTIDVTEITSGTYPTAVYMQGGIGTQYAGLAAFEMAGGEIKGDNSTVIRIGAGEAAYSSGLVCTATATFTMTGGKISGGEIIIKNDNTLNITNATVDATINAFGTDYAETKTTVKVAGATKVACLQIGEDVAVDVDGLTEGAEIFIAGAADTALFTSANAETVKDYIKAYDETAGVYVQDNTFYLAQAKAVLVTDVETSYTSVADALAAYYAAPTDAYVKLLADATVELNGNAVIDANGYAVTVSGTGKLSALDASNDDYDGCSAWTVTGDVTVEKNAFNPVNSNRYIVVENEDETYGAHRIEMDLTHVTLSTANAGLYFKSEYNCDDVLAAHVGDYGVVLSVEGGAEIASVMEAAFAPNEEHAVTGASTEVYGIFKNEGRTNEENTAIGETAILAVPYITVDGEKIGGITNVQMSLLDVMVKIDNAWDNDEGFVVTDEVKAEAQAFYTTWKDLGMSAWAEKLPNISAEA